MTFYVNIYSVSLNMVLISECFPSNHNSVNDVRALYRASLASANAQINQNNINKTITSRSVESAADSVVEIAEITHEYPGGIRAFLENSKMHLSSPDDIEKNLKKVKELAEQLTKTSLNVPTASTGATSLPINMKSLDLSTKTVGHNNLDGLNTIYRAQDISDNSQNVSINDSISAKPSSSQVRPKTQRRTSSKTIISPQKNLALTNTSSKSTTSLAATATPKPIALRKHKNTTTPRYLDVFTKPTVHEVRQVTSSTMTKFANTKYAAKFEQNWTPLTVSVVNIEL